VFELIKSRGINLSSEGHLELLLDLEEYLLEV
jgi:hypothetical protein